ncbi:GNAT family N-acetyltransferase [soil metagenome]
MTFLETERLILRRFTLEDTEAMIVLNGDPRVMRYLGTPVTPERMREEIMPRLLGEYDRFEGLGSFAAIHRDSGEFLAWTMLRPAPERERLLEVGYRIAPAFWRQGYATEIAGALVEAAFRDHDAVAVIGLTMAVNAGSRRVLEKAGLTYSHTFHPEWLEPLEGSDEGEVEYALTREDWGVISR